MGRKSLSYPGQEEIVAILHLGIFFLDLKEKVNCLNFVLQKGAKSPNSNSTDLQFGENWFLGAMWDDNVRVMKIAHSVAEM